MPERSERRQQFKIILHVAGAKHGGPPPDQDGAPMGYTVYMGHPGPMPFRDHERNCHVRRHNGAHPEMQAEMVCSGMEDHELGDPATACDRLVPDSDLAKLLDEIRIGVDNACWQAYFA